jgi:hypothetical protein
MLVIYGQIVGQQLCGGQRFEFNRKTKNIFNQHAQCKAFSTDPDNSSDISNLTQMIEVLNKHNEQSKLDGRNRRYKSQDGSGNGPFGDKR